MMKGIGSGLGMVMITSLVAGCAAGATDEGTESATGAIAQKRIVEVVLPNTNCDGSMINSWNGIQAMVNGKVSERTTTELRCATPGELTGKIRASSYASPLIIKIMMSEDDAKASTFSLRRWTNSPSCDNALTYGPAVAFDKSGFSDMIVGSRCDDRYYFLDLFDKLDTANPVDGPGSTRRVIELSLPNAPCTSSRLLDWGQMVPVVNGNVSAGTSTVEARCVPASDAPASVKEKATSSSYLVLKMFVSRNDWNGSSLSFRRWTNSSTCDNALTQGPWIVLDNAGQKNLHAAGRCDSSFYFIELLERTHAPAEAYPR